MFVCNLNWDKILWVYKIKLDGKAILFLVCKLTDSVEDLKFVELISFEQRAITNECKN